MENEIVNNEEVIVDVDTTTAPVEEELIEVSHFVTRDDLVSEIGEDAVAKIEDEATPVNEPIVVSEEV